MIIDYTSSSLRTLEKLDTGSEYCLPLQNAQQPRGLMVASIQKINPKSGFTLGKRF